MLTSLLTVSLATGGGLYDSYAGLSFRNPADNNIVYPGDGISHKEQCVLYSEIDNVSSINKGWDIGAGVGWNLNYPYTANGSIPATGVRSSVPLGGMGTGNFELRADGTFRQWCIESQSPGGGAKLDIGALDEAVLAVRTQVAGSQAAAATLRVNPPSNLPGVAAIQYHGAVPVSKLTVLDSKFPKGMAIYAHGEMLPFNANASMTPAVSFTLTLSNPDTKNPMTASLMLSLPLAAQPDTDRAASPLAPRVPAPPDTTTAAACKAACDNLTACRAWSWGQSSLACSLITNAVPQNFYAAGVTSGIKGAWSASADGSTLVHDRSEAAAAYPPGMVRQPPFPSKNKTAQCLAAQPNVGIDIDVGTELKVYPVPAGDAGIASCHVDCCKDPACSGWVVANSAAPPGADPNPCKVGTPCCWHKSGPITERPPCPFCISGLGSGGGGGGGSAGMNEQVGNFALHAAKGDDGATTKATLFTGATLAEIYTAFATGDAASAAGTQQQQQQQQTPKATDTHGAVANTVTIPPGGTGTVTVVFGWHFAERYFTDVSIGNFYAAHLHADASSAAEGMAGRLPDTVQQIAGVHKAFFESDTVPEFLQDTLVNSMSQFRSAFMTRDGRWRQWEAYDCVDVDSVHNDYQRHIPYAVFYPSLVMDTMESGWAKLQQSNGMITESLSGGCMGGTGTLDGGGGRVMGDVSTVFVIEALEMYEFTNDLGFLQRLMPVITKAIDWMVDVGTGGTPLPKRQCCTYDIIDFAGYDHTTFNSFLYLAAMRACQRIATYTNNPTLATKCSAAHDAAVPFMKQELWNETSSYFRAWSDSAKGAPPWVMADTLYGQVIANYLGLGENGKREMNSTWMVPPEMVASHLKVEAAFNPSPYGLTVVTTAGAPPKPPPPPPATPAACAPLVNALKYDSVWMGGAPDWTALQVALGSDGAGMDVAMEMAQRELDHYRTGLRDQWNVHGLYANDGYGLDGQPWCTAHYGFHMPLWFIPYAMTGQLYSAVDQSLIFAPKVSCPYRLPLIATGAVGILTCRLGDTEQGKNAGAAEPTFTLNVTAGSVTLKMLSSSGVACPASKLTAPLTPAVSISWP